MSTAFQIHLREHPAWTTFGGTRVRGTAFLGDEMLPAAALARRFDACAGNLAAFRELLERLNGFFAVVHVRGGTLLAAVDIIRSIPLFWGEADGAVIVGDDAAAVAERLGGRVMDPRAAAEFRLLGYVPGRGTLFAGVAQLLAGELLRAPGAATAPRAAPEPHFRHRHTEGPAAGREDRLGLLDETVARITDRLAAYAGGRTVCLPLSGGYDSRLIALALKRAGCRDVVAFSFGVPGNEESRISREVAGALGFRWEFVEYGNALWREWYGSPERRRYSAMAAGGCALPVLQDWPAIRELLRRGAIPADAVVVPGYAADLPTGVFSLASPGLYLRRRIGRDALERIIVASHYSLWPRTAGEDRLARERVRAELAELGPGLDDADLFEEWFTREKVAKFVVNAVRAYDFFGLDWWLPFYDRPFVDFWLGVPRSERLWQGLYTEYLRRLSREIAGREWPSRKNSAAERIKGLGRELLKGTPPWKRYLEAKRRRKVAARWRIYQGNPLGTWGRIPYEEFERLYTGEQTINSFYAEQFLVEFREEGKGDG